ncbi:MerR family transcriptional regulator [Thiomicrospira microaerophila]|uniref:MerR family transcriptional regulator n=1 Tax=Thiomicrospira microaerophila TaxID=406020 RepID=UPI00200EDAFA|nr:MerR family transcriptional regulator [Thiomicrospira microaerophila]UQB42834.1 MerR family transcriptional regulator [Thiomicrospira microaerophila]
MSQSLQLEIDLPDKKYFTIGEVSEICQLKSHVLRYWEQVFPQLNPNKRRGRRYYQKQDVVLLMEIKILLHEQGYTIPGAKARLAQSKFVPLESSKSNTNTPETSNNLMYELKSDLQTFKHHIEQSY